MAVNVRNNEGLPRGNLVVDKRQPIEDESLSVIQELGLQAEDSAVHNEERRKVKRYPMSIALLLLFTSFAFGQKVILVTNDNLPELRARYGPKIGPKPLAASTTDPSVVQIGTFSDAMYTNGTAAYEFYWGTDSSGYYTGPLVFNNITVFANGTSQSSGSIDGTGALGILFAADPALNTLSPCQPLTYLSQTTVDGDLMSIYQSSCIVIALQIEFSTDPYTFTLLDGSSFTTFGISNTFLIPASDHAALYTECDANDFCSGKTVPVYAYKQ